jgi:nucleoside-diphosphate-sugar epimerase
MKVLITGGSGFLGINLARYLLARGYRVKVIDMVPFSYPEKEQVEFILGDIRDEKAVAEAVSGVDLVVNAAAALPLYTREEIFSTDVDGLKLLLKASLEGKGSTVKRFVHISSTAVYGVPDHHPLLESDRLVGVGPYGEAKIMAEEACELYRSQGNVVPIIRPKSFVGPERLGVFAMLYEWASEGHGFPILGRGRNLYQYLDVEDLCAAIYACLSLPEERVNDTFNVGAKEFGTFRDDFQAVLNRAGFGKRVRCLPVKPAIAALRLLEALRLSPLYKWVYETAFQDSYVSIEKAEAALGFRPKYSNKAALIRNYEWYLANKESFKNATGISHRVPWSQGVLRFVKRLF